MKGRTLALCMLCASAASAKPAPPPPPRPAAVPPPPLGMLPSIGRVKVTLSKPQVVITEDILLPRGEWRGESLDFWVAFGAPGTPRAIDAHLLAVPDGALEASDTEVGDALTTDREPRRPVSAHPLLGKDTMAGVVVHVKKDVLTKALEAGNMAALRLRTALDIPADDPSGQKSLVVRLGASRGTPLTLGRIVFGIPKLTKADAHLCGAEADTHPLAFTPRMDASEPKIAPVLSTRHASDDLCLRFASTD